MYKTPEEFYLRLHFERSRFSRRLEDMLLVLAGKIVSLGTMKQEEFNELLDKIIKENNSAPLAQKTIRNQRTEMIRLFGLVKYVDGVAYPGSRLAKLAQTQDIPRFFKSFCKQFQFPAGFLKPKKVAEMVTAEVKFKPAQYILKLLKIAESKYGRAEIDAAEVAHLIFNDKRVTVNHDQPVKVLERLKELRDKNVRMDRTSDIIRYARDFLNYMVEANLLVEFEGMYAINKGESKAIHNLIADKGYFPKFNEAIDKSGSWDKESYKKVDDEWCEWFADGGEDDELETPASALIKDDSNYPEHWKKIKELLEKKNDTVRGSKLKDIGDEGEGIAFEYEKGAIKKARPDLVHMVKLVSKTVGLGYDLLSIHASEGRRKKYIEVKTTKKNYESSFDLPFTVSINEWSVAQQHGDDYFIYRVIITREGISIFEIQNPVLRHQEGNLIVEAVAYKVVYTNKSGKFLDL